MTEQILAYRGQNSYAQGEGAFTMSGSEPRESRPPKVEKSEGEQRPLRRPRIIGQEREPQKNPEQYIFNPDFKLGIMEAAGIASMVAPIQDEKEVIVSTPQIQGLMKNLVNAGLDETKVGKMSNAELVVVSQQLLRHGMPELGKGNLRELKGLGHRERLKITLIKKQIESAGSADEETLTEGKVDQYLRIEQASTGENHDLEVVHEEEITLGGSIKMKATIYRKKDGTYVMNRLPMTKYDSKTIEKIIKGSGIHEGEVKLSDWDAKDLDEKLEYLKDEFGLDTLPIDLGYRPQDWGYQSPDRDAHAAAGTPANPEYQLPDELEFRDLVFEMWRGPDQTHFPIGSPERVARLLALEADIDHRIQWTGPDSANWVVSASLEYTELRNEVRNDPAAQAQLDAIITPARRAQLENSRLLANVHYQAILTVAGEAAVADIRSQANQQLGLLNANFTTIDSSIAHIMEITRNKNDLPGREGLRFWFALSQIEMLRRANEILKRTEVHADPVENIRAATEAMNFFEKSRSSEIFGIARDKLVRMRQAVENSHDLRVTPEMKNILRKRIDSFEKVNGLLFRMEDSEGDPAELHKIAVTFSNEDWFYFYNRFFAEEMTDENGRQYFVDNHGVPIANLNILSETENAFAYQYLVDRWRVNRVQEMTRRNLNAAAPVNADETWIINRIHNDLTTRLATAHDPAVINQLNAALADVNVLWNTTGQPDFNGDERWVADNPLYNQIRMDALNNWYEQETFIGADGYEGGRLRNEIWEERIMQTHLKNRLTAAGVDGGRINDLLGHLQNPALPFDPVTNTIVPGTGNYDLMSAVQRDGYTIAKFKLADTLDRFRVYATDGQQVDTIWGEDTPYFARMATHFADWCLNEGQGDPRVVREVIAAMDEFSSGGDINPNWEHNGHLLAQNGTGARFYSIEHILENDNPLRVHITDLIQQETAGTGDPARDVESYIWMNQLMEGINPDEHVLDVNRELVNINWGEASEFVKSYPIHDMEDDRQKVVQWYMATDGGFRAWLNDPTPEQFGAMIHKYYSFRNVRRHPGAEFFLRLQHRLGEHLVDWLHYERNMTLPQFQELTRVCETLNLIDRRRSERLLNETAGREPVRTLNQTRLAAGEFGRQTVASPGWWVNSAYELLKALIAYLYSGK